MTTIRFPVVANTAPVISRVGTDDTFVELSFRRLGSETVELVATLVKYEGPGFPDRGEIGREVVGEDEAPIKAEDLAWVAKEVLDETNDYGRPYPLGFEEAVLKELEANPEVAREYMAYAIAHNNALIAAE